MYLKKRNELVARPALTSDTTTTEDTTTVGEDAEGMGTTTTGAEAAAEDTTGAEDTFLDKEGGVIMRDFRWRWS